ncbi:hypothetical protein [Bacillus mycoides]|uniref:hypothetical protein n=1 Tax=Bacillus mycoides TaxID=1405 RepID=UPI0011A88C0B|nr:hypothetical protein [Bacillus mycoides]
MKKIIFTAIGFSFSLSITAGFHDFNNIAFNKGDTGGAPARPDLVYNVGDTPAPAYSIGDGGGIVAQEN